MPGLQMGKENSSNALRREGEGAEVWPRGLKRVWHLIASPSSFPVVLTALVIGVREGNY